MATPTLSVRGLTRRYGAVTALAGIDLEVRPHEVLGLIGPNGAGKTTLMACIAGLEVPDQGQVQTANGVARRDALFYLPDGVCPYPQLRVAALLDLFAAAFGQGADAAARVEAALGLAPVRTKPAWTLSKGYRRRLLLAVALLAPQPLLLLDEPFDGLDLHQVRSVVALLRRLPAEGRTLLLSIHQLKDAERVCDRFALLAEGRLLGVGSLPELRVQAGLTAGGLEEVFLALT
jgi:ABC-2 type transport system ATP-binding protein